MSNRPKILVIAPQPFFANRGTPMNVKAIVECLGEAGYQVDLLVFPQGQNIEIANVRIIRTVNLPAIREIPVGISFSKVILDFFMFLTALRLVWGKKYAVLHGVEEGAVMAVVLAWINRSNSVFDMDSSIPEQLVDSGKFYWKLAAVPVKHIERLAMRSSSAVLTVCEALTRKAEKIVSSKKITQIEDFPTDSAEADPEVMENLKREFSVEEDRLVVYTGNFHKAQGIDLLLDAVNLASKNESFKLLLVGGGANGDPQFERIAKKVSELGLDSSVVMTGNRPLEEMNSFLALASVVVSPRVQGENTPLKVYSYMACGRPLVVTDIYSHTQVLSEESAYLARPEPVDFAEKLVLALGEDSSDKIVCARALVDEKYSRASFNSRLLNMYDQLLSGNSQ